MKYIAGSLLQLLGLFSALTLFYEILLTNYKRYGTQAGDYGW